MSAYADPVEDLVEFTAGTTAQADEVNGNFSEVANAVNDNDARITDNDARITDHDARITELEEPGESLIVVSIPFSAFSPLDSAVEWREDLGNGYGQRIGPEPVAFAFAPLQVPSIKDAPDLRIVQVELEACDASPDAFLLLTLSRCGALEGACEDLPEYAINTGEADAPGCRFFSANPEDPHVIDNFENTYRFNLSDTSDTGLMRTRAVRVFLERAR
jgi:hypothetical protein